MAASISAAGYGPCSSLGWGWSTPLFVGPPTARLKIPSTVLQQQQGRPSASRLSVDQLSTRPWEQRDVTRRSVQGGRRNLMNMMASSTGTKEKEKSKGSGMLRGANLSLMKILIQGEVAVGAVAAGLAFVGQINPLQGISFSTSALTMGCLGALPIFLISVLLEKSGVEFFRKIDQDTKLYVVQVFGAERNWPVVAFWSLVLAASAGFFEEILFRGVIQQWLGPNIGALPALGLTSILFGLAHSPVPGASSFTEACYGANFGLLYMMSGGNILVPIVAHIFYDFLTFVEVHQRATAQLQLTLKGDIPQEQLERKNVGKLVRQFNLSQKFVDMSFAIFKQLDLDKNGVIDQGELQLGLRTFGKFASDEETRQIMQQADLDQNNALSFDEWVRLLALNYSALLQPKDGEKLGEA